MENGMKRLLALMLAFALVFGTVPVTAANAMDNTFVPAQQGIGQRLGNGYVDFALGHFPEAYEAAIGQDNLVFSQYVTVTSPGALVVQPATPSDIDSEPVLPIEPSEVALWWYQNGQRRMSAGRLTYENSPVRAELRFAEVTFVETGSWTLRAYDGFEFAESPHRLELAVAERVQNGGEPIAPTNFSGGFDMSAFVLPVATSASSFDFQELLEANVGGAPFGPAGDTWNGHQTFGPFFHNGMGMNIDIGGTTGARYLATTGREEDWAGIALDVAAMNLLDNDLVTITGYMTDGMGNIIWVGPSAEFGGSDPGSSPGGINAATVVDITEKFTIQHRVTGADLGGFLRIRTAGGNSNNFRITSIEIYRSATGPSVDSRGIIFSLANPTQQADLGVAGAVSDNAPTGMQGSGPVEFTTHEYGGVRFFHVGNRSANYHGVDFLLTGFDLIPGEQYRLRVTGRMDTNAGGNIRFEGMPGHSWQGNHFRAAGQEFTLDITAPAYDANSLVLSGGNRTSIRITGDNEPLFYIYTVEFGSTYANAVAPFPANPPAPQPGPGFDLISANRLLDSAEALIAQIIEVLEDENPHTPGTDEDDVIDFIETALASLVARGLSVTADMTLDDADTTAEIWDFVGNIYLGINATAMRGATAPPAARGFAIELEVTNADGTPPPTVTVGAQVGTLTAGTAGTVTFPITTANIADGSYAAIVTNLPTGVAVQGQVMITGNTGTLTLAGSTLTVAGTTNTLTLTI